MTKTTFKTMQMTQLPNDYIPGEYDVICAKGKAAKSSSGNIFYNKLIQRALPVYKDASTKFEKSMIVSEIVDEIRSRSSTGTSGAGGGFIRRRSGIFYEAGNHFAREKVGQSLRDSLSNMYRSSAKAKKKRQNFVSAGVAGEFDLLIKRNSFISRRINKLTTTAAHSIETYQGSDNTNNSIQQLSVDDDAEKDEVNLIFSQINLEILEAFKNNTDLVDRFAEVEYCHKTML
mmetsp:Transcript_4231/g.4748  ORF Transcript_4231/g.4748 Transcript_4231/m.4748 type:complete len:231 (+) Transcript_4231:88-780(+)